MILELPYILGSFSTLNPFWDRLRAVVDRLDPVTAFLFVAAGISVSVFVFFSQRRVEWILIGVVASSALVGSSNDIIDNGASVIRWVGIGILVLAPLISERISNPYSGSPVLFGLYAFICFLFLSRGHDADYQVQRALLLLATCIAIPWATALVCKDGSSVSRLYMSIGLFGSAMALVAAVQLPSQLGVAARFYGTAKGVPYFAIALGSLLPFMFLNAWKAEHWTARVFCWLTLALGAVVLFFTAQRAGTLAGVISLVPMFLVLKTSMKFRVVIVGAAVVLGALVWAAHSGHSTFEYVSGRYSTQSGLSGRDAIWAMAWNLISKNIFIGHGTGGADVVSEYLFHNSYLEAWYNGGIAALLCFLAALGRSIYVGIVVVRRSAQGLKRELALSLGFTFSMCFVSFFEGVGAAASTITVILFLVTATISERLYRQRGLVREPASRTPETESIPSTAYPR